jgi:hypothetical protein
MITPTASGTCRLDTMTKGKTVSLIQRSFCVNDKDREYAETIYPMVQDSIREGIFLPRRSSSLCSRRYCAIGRFARKSTGIRFVSEAGRVFFQKWVLWLSDGTYTCL